MKIYYDFDNIEELPQKAVVTTGSFDGVHAGHRAIIESLCHTAKKIGGSSVLLTFHPHPRKVLYPEKEGKNLFLINSQKEKIELLSKTGLDYLFIIKFTLEFSKMSSVDFIRKILVDKLKVKKVIIGFNHHFGHNREGDFQYLIELGKYYNFEAEEISEQLIKNETVSSTKIRKALNDGEIQKANAYLDNYFVLSGKLETICQEEQKDNCYIYCLKIDGEDKLIPPEGIYISKLIIKENNLKGIINIDNNNVFLLTDKKLGNDFCKIFLIKKLSNNYYDLQGENLKNRFNNDISMINEMIY